MIVSPPLRDVDFHAVPFDAFGVCASTTAGPRESYDSPSGFFPSSMRSASFFFLGFASFELKIVISSRCRIPSLLASGLPLPFLRCAADVSPLRVTRAELTHRSGSGSSGEPAFFFPFNCRNPLLPAELAATQSRFFFVCSG